MPKPTYEELLDACRATDAYFIALVKQWAANEGRVVSERGTLLDGSENVRQLCEIAGKKICRVVSLAEGKE